ncbi:hypothetical protein [Iodidimonas sp. SYSU 1G8]|uniref:hypothetical protein n=1 Tax=Iodidimonas sp. SYSU 1G8 TaxID=3133967 RepID=UPI0031FE66FE
MRPEVHLLRHGFHLAAGEVLPLADAERMLDLLGAPDEALAHLLLKRRGFADNPAISAALAAAASRMPMGNMPPAMQGTPVADAFAVSDGWRATAAALRMLIDRDIAGTGETDAAASRLRETTAQAQPGVFDAHMRISGTNG